MKKLLITLAAGAATIALAGVAAAEEATVGTVDQPIVLTGAQLDGVTAGTAGGSWYSQGDADVYVDGSSVNIPGVYAAAAIDTYTICYGGVCTTGASTFAVVDGF